MKKLIKLLIILFILIAIILCSYKFIVSTKKEQKSTTLFLGDSITQRYKLDKYFFNYKTINSGVGGNTTNDILNDIDERVNKYNFDKVFLLVGINDLLFTTQTDEEIKNNIDKIIDSVYNKNPKSIVYLESVYPINTDINTDIPAISNNRIKKLNKLLKKECNNNKCIYINMYDDLVDKNGKLKKIYTNDGIHLNKLGYTIVTKNLLSYIKD